MKFFDSKRSGHIKVVVLSFLLSASFPSVPASAQMGKSCSGTDLKVRMPVSAGWFTFNDRGWQETVTEVDLYLVGEGKKPEDEEMRASQLLALPFLAVLLSCEVPQDQDWKRSGPLRRGYGVKNEIRVSAASGGDISVYFNGSLAATFLDTASGGVPVLPTGGHGYIVKIAPDERLPSGCVEVAFSE
ncbi:MAG: hypothetical protein IJL80_15890 [Treponema sp.]|nr:hypothetical protein [Treponema sp.]